MIDVHPGDNALNSVLKALPGVYAPPRRKAEESLRAFLRPKLKALQPHKDESPTKYKLRLIEAFRGPKWAIVRHGIALAFTEANGAATDEINSRLEQAFMDGMNESAYALSLNGVDAWPVTLAVVTGLVMAGLVTLNKRKVKRRRDIAYNDERLQGTVHSAILQGVSVDDLPEHVARTMAKARQNEMISYARASIYGASDSGAFFAGLEAEKAGIEVEKTWLSIMDMRVRPSHKHLHGTTIPLHAVFHGYYGDLRYPHDPQSVPQEIYRCRCRMAVHIAGRSPGEYSQSLLPTQTAAYRKWRDQQIRKAGGELELLKLHRRLGR